MVKTLNSCQRQPSDVAVGIINRFVKFLTSPIVLSVLCFTVIGDCAIAYTAIPHESIASEKQTKTKLTQSTTTVQPKPLAPPLQGVIYYGNQISLNGRILPGAWLQRRLSAAQLTTQISDAAIRQFFGVDLLNSNSPTKQPIQWYSSATKPPILVSTLAGGYRYLDITNFAKTSEWQMQVQGNTLVISTPNAKITEINQTKESLIERVTVNLDRPTPWQINQEALVKQNQPLSDDPNNPILKPSAPTTRDWTITLNGIADPALIQRYTPPPPPPIEKIPTPAPFPENLLKQILPSNENQQNITPTPPPLIKQVQVVNNQTIIRLEIPIGLAPLVSTAPNRLIIDVRPDTLLPRAITWAPGLNWRQQYVNLGQERFPVVWLEINPRTVGLKIRPIITNSNTLEGTAPLIQTAQQQLAVAAINGGYFNRNNRLPLGAIRRDGQWLSSPILNRGAIAWNDSGQFYLGRLTLLENLITANNQKLPILTLNSGYVQSGIARYTPAWGVNYSPLTDNEIILTIQKDQITNQLPAGKVGQTNFPIPTDGYLLVLRANAVTNASILPIGSSVKIDSSTSPGEFSNYPYILGAGPLLIQNRQIVLNGKGEQFSNAFVAQKAIRSGICRTTTGNLIIAAVHNRAGGAGPTLAEHAQLMQQIGCVDALNLDGGSSTSLYLGGQLLDRFPNTAARVHNGIGIFLQPR
ncbi:phosphodiester glycosidase family protein [Pelatocladus sp. BLCC-F211]|uniref:phosphodiester glycosidase family protein n=1 Tax=Pelatocladus sp. BLCC-F211 TaxID=3342752 RepID=UPI0035B7B62E